MAEFNLTPVFRMEMFIDAIINGTTPPEPQFREEFYLAKMAGMDVDLPEPFTRRELYLAYLAGMDVDLPSPVTRDEMYLAEACGMDVIAPDPVFRDEFWLDELKGGEGEKYQEFTGKIIQFFASRAAAIKKMEVTLEPIQDLHGQDAPYPAGGGVNKFDSSHATGASSGQAYGLTISINSDGESITASGTPTWTTTGAKQFRFFSLSDAYTHGYKTIYFLESKSSNISGISSSVFSADSGNTFAITITVTDVNEINFVVKPFVYSGDTPPTTYAPYSNICPITGWTGCEVKRTGKNLLNISVWTTGELNVSNGTVTPNSNKSVSPYIFLKSGTYTVSRLARSTGNWVKACFYDSEKVYVNQLFNNTNLTNTFTISSDGYIRIGTDYVAEESDHIQLEKNSSATSYEPYSGTTLSVTFPDGLINQWDEEWENGTYDANGEKSSNNNYVRSKNFISVKPSTEYYYKAPGSGRVVFYDNNKTFISRTQTVWDLAITTPENCYFVTFFVQGSTYNHDISINYPSTVTDYHPYHGDVVYGCTVDFVSGLLTSKMESVDLGTLDWTYFSAQARFRTGNLQSVIKAAGSSSSASGVNAICSQYALTSYNGTSSDDCSFGISVDGMLCIKDLRYTDATTFKAAMSGVQLVYELAEPITIQLTPQQISSLRGMNNIWSNSNGDLAVIAFGREVA